jgi:protease I
MPVNLVGCGPISCGYPWPMTAELKGIRVAILAAKGVEQIELLGPRKAVVDAGAGTTLLSVPDSVQDAPGGAVIQAVNDDIVPADRHRIDALVSEVSPSDFDALLLPGGAVNPDTLRQDPDAVAFVRAFVQSGKPVAAICHAPWILAEADVIRGRTLTSFPSVRTDLRNAGATVVDEEVVIDGNLVTSRDPDDLPAFCEAVVRLFAAG